MFCSRTGCGNDIDHRSRVVMTVCLCIAGKLLSAGNLSDRNNKFTEKKLNLIQEWDKTFPENDKVRHSKVTFHNRYGITLAADLYIPKNAEGKLSAIAISGPFGAVKEQSSGLYAQTLAERGFLTIAFDPSYTGESGGEPRYVASPDINTEDFSAAERVLKQKATLEDYNNPNANSRARSSNISEIRISCSILFISFFFSSYFSGLYLFSINCNKRFLASGK
jgi:hypothetical protein